ncbi:hypothetical protein SAMN04489722_103235 [Algibacter lectus]|nr:hypothetical protein SAMN04489722_103235 [Algibacter lectus]
MAFFQEPITPSSTAITASTDYDNYAGKIRLNLDDSVPSITHTKRCAKVMFILTENGIEFFFKNSILLEFITLNIC